MEEEHNHDHESDDNDGKGDHDTEAGNGLSPLEALAKAQLPPPSSSPPAAPAPSSSSSASASLQQGLALCIATMQAMATDIANDKNATDEHFTAIEDKVTRIDAQLDTTNLQVAAIGDHQSDMANAVSQLHDKYNTLSDMHTRLALDVAAQQARLALAESTTPTEQIIHDDDFNRSPDLSVVKCNAVDTIPKLAFIAATETWLGRLGLNNADNKHYTIHGKEHDKYFTIRFHGAISIAGPLVAAAMRYLRQDGRFIDIAANYDKTNSDGTITESTSRIYINLDKSPRQSRIETVTRNLGRMLLEEYPDRISWSRRDALVYIDHMALGQVQINNADSPPIIYWDLGVIGKANVGASLKTLPGRTAITDKLATTTATKRIDTSHFRL